MAAGLLIYHVRKGTLESNKLDKIIEIFKYSVVTSALTTVTLIISDLFKERDYDKNEMIAFNHYIPYVIDTTGTIDKKINFCKFFAAVTPKGELQEGWKTYTLYLENERDKIIAINAQSKKTVQNSTDRDTAASNEQLKSLEVAEVKKNKILEEVNAVENTIYLVILGADLTRETANVELRKVTAISQNATIYKKGRWYRTVIPAKSFEEAIRLRSRVKTQFATKTDAYVVSLKTWCNSTEFSSKENCTICQ